MEFMRSIESFLKNSELLKEAKSMEGRSNDLNHLDRPLRKKGQRQEELNLVEKIGVKIDSGYSKEIIDHIHSVPEYRIYAEANLEEQEVNGKPCLVRQDIDWNQKDDFGRTNRQRAENGLAPITKDHQTVELHHIGQENDSPLAELTTKEHRGVDNDTILHNKSKVSEIDRNAFIAEKSNHWKLRAIVG